MSSSYPAIKAHSDRTYENAILILEQRRNTVRSELKPITQVPTQPNHNASTARGVPSLVGMKEWLAQLGHSEADINALNIIHIAGTKGKGSTCSFTESFLRAHADRTGFPRRTGLYTSPHLLDPEERIRIRFLPLAREALAKYFFEVYDRLPQIATAPDLSKPPVERGPRFLQLWALLAFHTFIREGVDAVVLETHNGGENDATNVVAKPLVTAVTTLGLDHIEILGNTIESIAWHKGGIYKIGAVALSTQQESSAATEVLRQRARDVGEAVSIIDDDERLPADAMHLEPSVQRKNASLALAAAEALLKQTSGGQLSVEDIQTGVDQWNWPGRYQILRRGPQTWFLDAAHCESSVALAAQWFDKESRRLASRKVTRVLVFSHMNKLRDARALLERLIFALKDSSITIDHVIFSTYDETVDASAERPEIFEVFNDMWREHLPNTTIWEEPAIRSAVEQVQKLDPEHGEMHVLVTGSQYLLGPVLRQLKGND
ncbi:Putative folylpolyglutamate synthetase, mur-like, catalytic domain superfamily [Septoria linicola]|uniref:tetrahydrofolate synthase n=1 Tax=Septoria linicola TaxID=215465 RepID=A0A9Q9ENF8_9PEZI|nr:putative folylpolyglutamate synthetase, mur-like, catalytic domain superfamily [Septoria linicola]USW56534.1 Putative folylpolyglutamate synthetase, mur-like, catalytic domain superfamily [Septoria linicola]